MANPVKGEAAFTVDGREMTLVFSVNALCTLEERLDMTVMEIGQRFSDPTKLRLGFMREVFRVGLLERHGEISPDEAGSLLHSVGLQNVASLLGKAFFLAFDDGKGGASKRPRKAAETPPAGTGEASTGVGAS